MKGQAEVRLADRLAVFGEAGDMPHRFGLLPRAIIDLALPGEGERAGAPHIERAAGRDAPPAERAALGRGPWALEPIDRGQIGRARQREVAAIGAIGAFAIVLTLDDFGNEAIQIEIALAMAMRAEVHLHAVDIGGEVRSMIEVEAPQEVLVRLAATGMLRRDHARHGFQQFGDLEQRPHEEIGPAETAFARCAGNADLVLATAKDDDLVRLALAGCGQQPVLTLCR